MSRVPGMVRILSVDDHPLLRKGIAVVINAEADMKLVIEVLHLIAAGKSNKQIADVLFVA